MKDSISQHTSNNLLGKVASCVIYLLWFDYKHILSDGCLSSCFVKPFNLVTSILGAVE